MTRALKIWPLLTGSIRYEKILSTRNRGHGEFIDAPILAYLNSGRIMTWTFSAAYRFSRRGEISILEGRISE